MVRRCRQGKYLKATRGDAVRRLSGPDPSPHKIEENWLGCFPTTKTASHVNAKSRLPDGPWHAARLRQRPIAAIGARHGRRPSGGGEELGERHPLDVGADAVARYFRIEDECAQAQRLRVMAEPDRGG
jgi:hypothetical protein